VAMVARASPVGRPRVGALLRAPYRAARARIHADLVAAGFEDLHLAHLDVFQHPGPEGVAPSELAERTGVSRQAMNHLLGQLERSGYLRREPNGSGRSDARYKVVRVTRRGAAARASIQQSLDRLEAEWRRALGRDAFDALLGHLQRLNGLLTDPEGVSRADPPGPAGR
jgi:DNA-binding MarR family transcriptional regulator